MKNNKYMYMLFFLIDNGHRLIISSMLDIINNLLTNLIPLPPQTPNKQLWYSRSQKMLKISFTMNHFPPLWFHAIKIFLKKNFVQTQPSPFFYEIYNFPYLIKKTIHNSIYFFNFWFNITLEKFIILCNIYTFQTYFKLRIFILFYIVTV